MEAQKGSPAHWAGVATPEGSTAFPQGRPGLLWEEPPGGKEEPCPVRPGWIRPLWCQRPFPLVGRWPGAWRTCLEGGGGTGGGSKLSSVPGTHATQHGAAGTKASCSLVDITGAPSRAGFGGR